MQRTDDVAGLLAKRFLKHTSRPAYTINGAFPQIHDDLKTNTAKEMEKYDEKVKKLLSEVGFEPTPTEVDCDLNAAP